MIEAGLNSSALRCLVIVASVIAGSSSQAAMTEWCIPSDGCMEAEPLRNDGFNTCEETCSLSRPVRVEGMNGILFDVACRGDSASYDYRMLFLEFVDDTGQDSALIIRNHGAEQLERCQEDGAQ
jgi:hypothetical protein